MLTPTVCTVACLPQNYTQSEQQLLKLFNRTTLPVQLVKIIQNPFTDNTAFNIITYLHDRFALKSSFLLIFLTMLVPASMFLVPVQAQEEPELVVSTGVNGLQELPLKAIKDSDGEINTQNDFEIEPQHVITVEQGKDFHVLPSDGSIKAVKVTDEQRQTTDLQFSQADGRVTQNLQSKAYLLDVIVLMENDDQFLYETVLAVLAPGQTINQVNVQNIIQNFVTTTSESHTTVVLGDDNDTDDGGTDQDREEICRFTPSHPICTPDENGSCGEGFAMNEDGQCFPRGDCPDGYTRPNDDETGACISKEKLDQCPDGSWKYPSDSCYTPNPVPAIEETSNDTSSEEEIPVNEDGEPLTSNCGGEPCTASEKEDSTTVDHIPGEPHTPTDSEGEQEQSDDEQAEEQQPEQEESNAEDSEQETE